MAAYDTSRTVYGSAPVANRLGGFVTGFFSALAAWNNARLTRNALNALSDRELEDIGLIRGDIDEVVNRL